MTYKENTPTFNSGNRKIVNYKDFIQNEPQEEQELKDIKRSFKKSEVGTQEHKLKYNKVTHKMDDLVEGEVDDKLDSLEESSDFRRDINYEKTSQDSLICPYCGVEQADHPENIMSGGGGEAPEFAECECDTCGAKFSASKSVIVEYTTDRI